MEALQDIFPRVWPLNDPIKPFQAAHRPQAAECGHRASAGSRAVPTEMLHQNCRARGCQAKAGLGHRCFPESLCSGKPCVRARQWAGWCSSLAGSSHPWQVLLPRMRSCAGSSAAAERALSIRQQVPLVSLLGWVDRRGWHGLDEGANCETGLRLWQQINACGTAVHGVPPA